MTLYNGYTESPEVTAERWQRIKARHAELNAQIDAQIPAHALNEDGIDELENEEDMCPDCGRDLTYTESVMIYAQTLEQPAEYSQWAECGNCDYSEELLG